MIRRQQMLAKKTISKKNKKMQTSDQIPCNATSYLQPLLFSKPIFFSEIDPILFSKKFSLS